MYCRFHARLIIHLILSSHIQWEFTPISHRMFVKMRKSSTRYQQAQRHFDDQPILNLTYFFYVEQIFKRHLFNLKGMTNQFRVFTDKNHHDGHARGCEKSISGLRYSPIYFDQCSLRSSLPDAVTYLLILPPAVLVTILTRCLPWI